jgi:environmental stress-induced protein Ves
MMIRIIKKHELQISRWTGGTTTELFIFPSTASYKKIDFDFRISTATIEVDKSTFTSLKGVQRTLMVLEGSLELHHENHHAIILKPFQKDSFMGDWQTISRGQAVDFNLMLRDSKLSEHVEAISIKQNNSITLNPERHGFIYFYKGDAVLNEETLLTCGDAVYFDNVCPITLHAKSKIQIIHVSLQ